MQILNIGLNTKHGGTLNVRAVTAALIGRCIVPVYCGTFASDTEPTAVYVVRDVSSVQLFRLAEALAQDAIAAYDVVAKRGRIIGPRADAWGAFCPEFFIMPTGERLKGDE